MLKQNVILEKSKKKNLKILQNLSTNYLYLWKIVKKFKHGIIGSNAQSSNDCAYINSSISLIAEFSCPIPFVNNIPSDSEICSNSNYSNLDNSFLNSPFSIEEVSFTIKSFKSKSTPGLDKINYLILQNLPASFLQMLLLVFNDIFLIIHFLVNGKIS